MNSDKKRLAKHPERPILKGMKKLAICLVLAGALLTACGPKKQDPFTVEDAFIRATPAKVTAGYLLLTNNGSDNDAILSVDASWAGKVELHNVTTDDKGVLTMAPVNDIALPAGQTTGLRPNGFHIMFFDVKDELNVGDTREATVNFGRGQPLKVTFKVKPITYKGAGSDTDAPEHAHH
jgi:copper(I)-binding protein